MKKLSKLTESIWSDIQKRSAGDTIRKEDDPNLLDAQGFVEYLRKIYKNVNTDLYIFKDLNDLITVPMFETNFGTKSTWFIEYDCNDNSVLIWEPFLYKDDKLFDKLKRNYNVKKYRINRNFTDNFLITPKTGKSSNTFFIEIIDYLLENTSVFYDRILVKNDKITESLWSDIQKRSTGETVRKEDDINHLNINEFYDYLSNTYESINPKRYVIDWPLDDLITFPFICHKTLFNAWFQFKESGDEILYVALPDFISWGYPHIEDDFKLESYPDDEKYVSVFPKDGSKLTNSFAVTVIDYLLNNSDDNLFIKKERS